MGTLYFDIGIDRKALTPSTHDPLYQRKQQQQQQYDLSNDHNESIQGDYSVQYGIFTIHVCVPNITFCAAERNNQQNHKYHKYDRDANKNSNTSQAITNFNGRDGHQWDLHFDMIVNFESSVKDEVLHKDTNSTRFEDIDYYEAVIPIPLDGISGIDGRHCPLVFEYIHSNNDNNNNNDIADDSAIVNNCLLDTVVLHCKIHII
jgi:hypothetical protein